MTDWGSEKVIDCLAPLSLGALPKLQTCDYKPVGRFPIIDQGQSFIAGWTDDNSGLVSTDLPVIVFGDHTRAFKFVNFPFVRGADGTQVLKPRDGIDPLFFYFACLAVDLPARGYNRHFSVLKEKTIALPTSIEQQVIGKVLRQLDELIKLQSELTVSTERTKRIVLRDLFSRGLRGDTQIETDFGTVPEYWQVSTVGDHFTVVSGGTPSRGNDAYWAGGTIPWIKTTEVNYDVIESAEEYVTEAGLANSAAKMLPTGTLLMAMYGQGVTRGRVAVLGIDATCNQACAAINARDEAVLSTYLFHFLTYRYEAIRQMAHGGQQQNLNLEIVRNLPLAFPEDRDEQREIVEILDAVHRKANLHKRKRALLEVLFNTLLRKLMTGEIRVADLDLSALGHMPVQEAAA
jgi:type I restriction enzyme S subunit